MTLAKALFLLGLGLAPRLAAQCTPEELQKLTAADGEAGDKIGRSVALSGNRAVIGAELDDDRGTDAGAAYVYELAGGSWMQVAKLTASDGFAGANFAYAVGIAGDWIAIGCPNDDDQGSFSGSIHLFRYDGATWVPSGKLYATDAAAGDSLGYALSMTSQRILATAINDDDAGFSSGSAYVFEWNGATWVQVAKLVASDAQSLDDFGLSAAIHGDRAIVGTWKDDDLGTDSGAAYIYSFNGSTWVEQAKVKATDGANFHRFGWSVAISDLGALVGSKDQNGNRGAVYAFAFDGSSWTQTAKLTASDGSPGDSFGWSLAMNDHEALVGAAGEGVPFTLSGAVYWLRHDGSAWVEAAKLTASDRADGDIFGNAVALDGDGALVSASWDDDRGTDSGSAYVFDLIPGVDARWSNYGSGWAGTNGVPSFTAQSDPVLGSTITIDLENSSSAYTWAVLLFGRMRASTPSPYDGTILVGPFTLNAPRYFLRLPVGTTPISFAIPNDLTLLGRTFTLQALEGDPGASKGVSFTAGLELVVGDC